MFLQQLATVTSISCRELCCWHFFDPLWRRFAIVDIARRDFKLNWQPKPIDRTMDFCRISGSTPAYRLWFITGCFGTVVDVPECGYHL